MQRTAATLVLIALLSAVSAPLVSAQDRSVIAAAQQPGAGEARTVAATVDGDTVYSDEVQDTLSIVLGERQVATAALPALQAQALEQLIGRRLIEAHLLENGYTPTKAEIEQANALFVSQLRSRNVTPKQYLEDRNMTEEQLRRRLIGQLTWANGWPRYLNQHLNDERFEQYIRSHPGEFDGTERRASHVLLRVDRPQDPSAFRQTVRRAATLRSQIAEGKLRFSEAVEKYSDGPSRRHVPRGDLGFFPRHGVMDENFAKAAFELKKGQISEPIASPFGIHLIQCTEIKLGTKSWQDIRSEITPLARKTLIDAVSREVFAELAGRLRTVAKVEFTGKLPYLKPGTREVVKP